MALLKFRVRTDPRNNPRTGGKMWLRVVSVNGVKINNWRLVRSGDVVEVESGASVLLEPLNAEAQAANDAYLAVGKVEAGNQRLRWPHGFGRW